MKLLDYQVREFTSDLPQSEHLPNIQAGQQVISVKIPNNLPSKCFITGYGEISTFQYQILLKGLMQGIIKAKTIAELGSDTPISKVHKQLLKFYTEQLESSYFLSIDDVKNIKHELGCEYLDKIKSDLEVSIKNINEKILPQ